MRAEIKWPSFTNSKFENTNASELGGGRLLNCLLEPGTKLNFQNRKLSLMYGKTAEEIKKTFSIVNDFIPEEKAELISENKSVYID